MATDQQEKKKRQATFLEPYRNKQGALGAAEGVIGLSMLHELFEGNAQHAGAFLGYAVDAKGKVGTLALRREWERFGLKCQGRVKVKRGFAEGESVDALRDRYMAETSRKEKSPVFTWRLPASAEHGICAAICDLHYGPREMDYARWQVMRDWIKDDKSRRWMYLGDGLNVQTKNSPGERDYLSQEEAESLLEADFADIADQCFFILSGNHEARLARETGVETLDPLGRIAEKLGVYYGGLETLLRVRVEQGKKSECYDGYAHHGVSGATTLGGQLAGLERAVRNYCVEFLVMGHTHARIVAEIERLALCGETEKDEESGEEWATVELRETVVAYAGSYLKHQHGGYSRAKILSPANLGSISLHFYASRHAVHGRK